MLSKKTLVVLIFLVFGLTVSSGAVKITSDNVYKNGNSFWHQGIFSPTNYLPLDGSSSMSGDLDLSDNALLNVNWSESDDGPGSEMDADLLDNLNRSEFAMRTRTFWAGGGSSTDYFKIGEITGGQRADFKAHIRASTRAASSEHRSVTLRGKFIRDNYNYEHKVTGTTSYSDTVDFLVTRDTSTDYDTHYLYVRADSYTSTPITIEYATWGNFDFKEIDQSNIVGEVIHDTGNSGDSPSMRLNVGTLNANTKNFVQKINSTYNAVYTSQESPDARAVVEGTERLENGTAEVDLPNHFTKVVSESAPELLIQITPRDYVPGSLGVTQRTRSGFKVEGPHESNVGFDYRVTGVREGKENKEVVRKK